jgi:hypothetical protein
VYGIKYYDFDLRSKSVADGQRIQSVEEAVEEGRHQQTAPTHIRGSESTVRNDCNTDEYSRQ